MQGILKTSLNISKAVVVLALAASMNSVAWADSISPSQEATSIGQTEVKDAAHQAIALKPPTEKSSKRAAVALRAGSIMNAYFPASDSYLF
jgi:hypothetical protein